MEKLRIQNASSLNEKLNWKSESKKQKKIYFSLSSLFDSIFRLPQNKNIRAIQEIFFLEEHLNTVITRVLVKNSNSIIAHTLNPIEYTIQLFRIQ